jgi:hypothetical protein
LKGSVCLGDEFAPNSIVAGSRVTLLSGKVPTVYIVRQLPDSNSTAHPPQLPVWGALLRNPVRVQLLMLRLSQFRGVLHTSEIAT